MGQGLQVGRLFNETARSLGDAITTVLDRGDALVIGHAPYVMKDFPKVSTDCSLAAFRYEPVALPDPGVVGRQQRQAWRVLPSHAPQNPAFAPAPSIAHVVGRGELRALGSQDPLCRNRVLIDIDTSLIRGLAQRREAFVLLVGRGSHDARRLWSHLLTSSGTALRRQFTVGREARLTIAIESALRGSGRFCQRLVAINIALAGLAFFLNVEQGGIEPPTS